MMTVVSGLCKPCELGRNFVPRIGRKRHISALAVAATPHPLPKFQALEPVRPDLIPRRRIPKSGIIGRTSSQSRKVRGSTPRSMESLPFAPILPSLLLTSGMAVPEGRNVRHLQWQPH